MTAGTTATLRIDSEDIEVVDNFCLQGSTNNNKGISIQEILCRRALGRAAIKTLWDMSVQSSNSRQN